MAKLGKRVGCGAGFSPKKLAYAPATYSLPAPKATTTKTNFYLPHVLSKVLETFTERKSHTHTPKPTHRIIESFKKRAFQFSNQIVDAAVSTASLWCCTVTPCPRHAPL